MKKLLIMFVVALIAAIGVSPAMAGPSRALIQEMGSVIAKDEVNIDLDVASHSFNVAGPDDTDLGAGNATVGGTTVSSVNVSLVDNLELRIGRLPGTKSYLSLPGALGVAGNNYGLTLKGAIPNVPGLAAWVGYGMVSEEDVDSSDSAGDTDGSSFRVGVAYTWAGPVVVNGTIGYGADAGSVAGVDLGDVKTIEAAAAVLYPVRPTLLVGAELLYASIKTTDGALGDVDLSVLAPALGARAIAGNWTIDAVVALLGTSIDTDIDGADTAKSTVVGVPTLRVNYKF